ncbi:PREDICTED: uncharacterized protein LOC106330057 [Brassica oleracea var. oleracea]|uniref:uncharacterized protein LOC106330057 n=1 Tax=Brassica oleracea var. oleracea TaxID=109376 RepID=UPI0006A74BE6|nr:PREDICTED: uncharacterized protein LOC106330057 [Brassica oleracea var. oleracea]
MIHPSVNSPTNMDEEESMLLEKEDEEETNVIHQLMKLKRSQWWIFVFISIFFLIFLISAQAVAVLLGRFYYGQGGNSKWISSLVQTVGFPILYLPLRLLPASSHPSSSSSCSFKTGLDIFFSWSCYWLRQSGILSMIWKFKEQEKLKKDAFVIRRYDHQKTVLLPKAQYDWKHIRFLDYKSVDEYNSVLFRIVSLLRLCGEKVTEEEMLNKTLSTFPQTNMVLQQQYRERNFATYTELIECLLLAKANNELLLKNSEMRPPGTAPLPDISKLAIEPKKESNLVQHNDHPGPNRGRSQGQGRGSFKAHGRGRGRGTTPGFSRGRGRGRSVSFKRQIKADRCHRCGMGNH